MELFDSHVHMEGMEAIGGCEVVLERARLQGVTRAIAVGGSEALDRSAVAAGRRHPAMLGVAIGYDRDQAGELAADDSACDAAVGRLESRLTALRREGLPLVAVGEIGLDYHYAAESAPAQRRLFAAQLALARRLELPVIIHSREADADTLAALREHVSLWRGDPERIGVLHCFTGGAAFARLLLELGLAISFSGIVTFRNADPLRAVAAEIPDDRLLIETDSPFLAPVPVRGRQNEPAHVRHVAACLATARGVAVEAVAAQTWDNAARLFAIT